MFSFSQKTKKRGIVALLVVMVTVYTFGFTLFRPTTTYAFTDVNQGLRNVTDNIGDALLAAGLGALVNGTSYFMRKIAYDTAKYVVSGGKGQSALGFQEGFGEYLKNTALDSAAGAIQDFGEPFGLNLCTPPDLRVQIGLQVSLSKIVESQYGGADGSAPVQPDCTWNQFKESWRNAPETLLNDQSVLAKFNDSLKHSQGDIGIALSFMGKVENIAISQQANNQLDRLEGQGFKPITDRISGNIRTPASIIQEETKTLTGNYTTKLNTEQIAGIYGSGALQILPSALSIFASTLTSALLQNVLEKGIFPNKTDGGSAVDFYAANVRNNRAAAEAAFSYLITGVPQRPLTAYDVVTEYSTCNENPGLNNCVMDSGLVQATDRARVEVPLTIAEAIEQNLLHANWPLIPPTNARNTDAQYCYSSAYCYSNIQKLRKARILPLGFEIAVQKSNPDTPLTLGQVIQGFNVSSSPYYKLIDPNWVIKAPEARCEALVNGPELLTENAANRRQECVDFSTCLQTDANGQCLGFGYCTQEENIWKIPGNSCPQQFNTCKTYTSTSGAVASYLSRTLDIQSCSADSVGCRAYSAEQENNTWVETDTVDLARVFAGRTQSLHFNAKINNQQCPAGAEGCTLFVDPITEERVFLKKAPDYLQCYDANIDTPNTIEWPETSAELTAIAERQSQSCSTFARACTADEMGCDQYTPKDGGIAVTGVVGGGACPSQCVGYETFKQESTVFEPAKFPLNFIARDAETCAIQHVGCDEFTNIGVARAGGESLEYYSNLKRCELPQGNNGKVFYSWEGSEIQGYVLKRHTLLQITDVDQTYIGELGLSYQGGESASSVFPVGSPAYADDAGVVMQKNYDVCNQVAYNELLANPYSPNAASPDCRAFYDSNGNIYYRLLRDTVTVSAQCTPLRKTDSQLFIDSNITNATVCQDKGGVWGSGQCNRCMNGGVYEANTAGAGGSCVYNSIRSEATLCPATANKCRSYIGNTGNNIEQVASFGFEPQGNSVDALNQARAGWVGAVSVEAESLQVGLNSLRVNGSSVGYNFESGKLQPGAWYELRFWARGNGSFGISSGFAQNNQTVGVPFTFDPLTNSNALAPISTEWQEYRVGPVQFVGNGAEGVQLYFGSQANGTSQFYFLDNISLVQIGGSSSNHVYLIKDSWKTPEGYDVPLACDATPNDGLPGTYLGCREFTKRDGSTIAITGFDRLCRAEAVGCRALVDTQNTVTGNRPEDKQIYHAVCRKPSVQTTATQCSVTVVESATESNTYSCTVKTGETECRIKTPMPVSDMVTMQSDGCISVGGSCDDSSKDRLFVDRSTTVTRPDSEVIYLTHRSEFVCNQQQMGCMKVGLEERDGTTTTYRELFVKNDPRGYGDTLCTGNEVGCAAFRQDNNTVYFKDPKVTGNSICVYREKVERNGGVYSGWFLASDETTPCYPDYLGAGNEYGLWSQGTAGNYQGFVGACDAGSNGCTELVDRASVSTSTPQGKSYFVIMNDRLTQNVGECAGKVSQKEGCVLFDMTENPAKTYNTGASYAQSVSATPPNSLVAPVTTGGTDANLILKVDRDRQCREWLACKTSITVYDTDGKPQTLCQQYAACLKMDAFGGCAEWAAVNNDNTRMTEQKYVSREVTWSAPEYSGYTFFGAYNPSNYVYLFFDGRTEAYLGYEMSHANFASGSGFEAQGCRQRSGTGYVKQDGAVCGFDEGGRCYRQRCIYPVNDRFTFTPAVGDSEAVRQSNLEKILERLQPGICKSYPETTSPYSTEIAVTEIGDADRRENGGQSRVDYTQKKEKYERANVCQPGTDCSCEYVKVEYKSGVIDYWPVHNDTARMIPSGICMGGEQDGSPCTDSNQCGSGGTCSMVKQKGNFYGQRGLCIEYDLSRPLGISKPTAKMHEAFACLTWLPIQISASSLDLNNADPQAGYYPVASYDSPQGGGHAYCTESTNRGAGYYNTDLDTQANIGPFGPGVAWGPGTNMRLWGTNENNFTYYDSFTTTAQGVFSSNRVTNYGTIGTTNLYRTLMRFDDLQSTNQVEIAEHRLKIYRAFQAWAWNHIGQSARILRLDTLGGSKPKYYDSQKNVYGFAPYIDDASDHEDTGTMMHPPRLFANNSGARGIYLDGYYMNPGVGYFYPSVGTAALSPEIGFSANSVLNKYIEVDEKVESQLNEKDIKSIHFVPMAYPDGAQGYNPALLTKDMSIDFNALREMPVGENRAFRRDVPAYTGSVANGEDARFETRDSTGRMIHVAYLLERGTPGVGGDGLLSYGEYENASGGYWDTYKANPQLHERSKIHRRYVSLVFAEQELSFSGLRAGEARIPVGLTDPFTADCKLASGGRNWLAIGMDFNKDGEFLGYISRWCLNTGYEDAGEQGGIRLATIANMQDRCLEYRAVVNGVDQIRDNNKAWTDRVWKNSMYLSAESVFLSVLKQQELAGVAGFAPYGSLNNNPNNPVLVVNSNTVSSTINRNNLYEFSDYKFGVPFQCQGGDGFGGTVALGNYMFNLQNGCAPGDEGVKDLTTSIAGNGGSAGESVLTQLFLKYYAARTFEIGASVSFSKDSGDVGSGTSTRPPQIFSINPYECRQRGGNCTAAEANAFTINFRNYTMIDYDGDSVPDEDKNRQGSADPIIADGVYQAVVNFFAYADDNRMPIKRVMVSWGDGSFANKDTVGLYKNRKPYCAATDDFAYSYNAEADSGLGRCVGTQITCGSSDDCRYAGPNATAVACAIPTVSGSENQRQGICRYTEQINSRSEDITYGAQCSSTAECVPIGSDYRYECEVGSDRSGVCKYIRDARPSTQNQWDSGFCYSANDCPPAGIANTTAQCVVSGSETAQNLPKRHFGDAPRACKDEYFEFTHVYQCTDADTNATVGSIRTSTPEAYARLRERANISDETRVCVFKPGVQVLDNWGYCNNERATGPNCNGSACYNDNAVSTCDIDQGAYTFYKGNIIIVPS